MLSRRVLNRTLVYQIHREDAPPGNDQKGLLEGKPTVQLNRTLGFKALGAWRDMGRVEAPSLLNGNTEFKPTPQHGTFSCHVPDNMFVSTVVLNLLTIGHCRPSKPIREKQLGSQHPSPNVKNPLRIRAAN